MAYGYWFNGVSEKRATFSLFARKVPFGNSYFVVCGIEPFLKVATNLHFSTKSLEYLDSIKDSRGKKFFPSRFLYYLEELTPNEIDIFSLEEGNIATSGEPILRVEAPLAIAQMLETIAINYISFSSLIATKATRVKLAARGKTVLDFGMRRAQGIDGSVTASRAAYIGGCDATSNTLAGYLLSIPVKGTQAHSWVMSFRNEEEAFYKFAKAMPGNTIFLVDTYDTYQGVKEAIKTAKKLIREGITTVGIRLDSGDLLHLSRYARTHLDEAGLEEVKIFVSGDLDEYRIEELESQQAPIDAYGVGTKLLTGGGECALQMVYKLSAIKEDGRWVDKIKKSNSPEKITLPGRQNIKRLYNKGQVIGDVIVDVDHEEEKIVTLEGNKILLEYDSYRYLLSKVVEKGKIITESNIERAKENVNNALKSIPDECKKLSNPSKIPVMLDKHLFLKTTSLINKI